MLKVFMLDTNNSTALDMIDIALVIWRRKWRLTKWESKSFLFRVCYSQEVSHYHLCFGRDSKAGSGMGKLYNGKWNASGMPWLEAVGKKKL